jgi:thiol:disulfide interchange protein
VPGAVPEAAAGEAASGAIWSTALLAFAGAVLGGLILNIMPCVFPILSLKALSLARAGETGSQARHEALAYTAGVVLVCVALGGILLGLRAAGASAGWAFQLQDPRVILVLLLLVTAIAFNLAGLFEIAAPGFINRAAANGNSGAFATGALAAFIATPCTGPFMGAALGAALVLPWYAALAIFAGLGLGLALPFLALGFIPALRRRRPRPGAWMDTFRRILSVPMFLTALALAWVLGRQAGVGGMTLGLGAALLLAFGLWWGGVRQAKGKSHAWTPAVPVLIAALAAVALVRAAPAGPAVAGAQVAGGHESFSEQRLAALRQEGRPVFAYFTADWCITCKVNERGVIETEAVEKVLGQHKVAVLVGDWTNGDPVLGKFIEAHNRAGVPLYLWYVPGEPQPRVLPQILTRAMLADLAALPRGS